MKYNCLIIDDEIELANNTCEYLNLFGVKSISRNSLEDGRKFLNENEIDLILLDINLTDGSGLDFCKEIREKSEIPILFISARNTDDDKIIALNIGGDDYVEKPYSLGVLLAKVKAVLKRYGKQSIDKYDDGNLIVDLINKTVIVKNKEIKLTSLEYKLLAYLIENKGRLVTKDELFENVWSDKFTQDGTLNVHIRKIREQIEEDPNNPEYISTVWKEGYRFLRKENRVSMKKIYLFLFIIITVIVEILFTIYCIRQESYYKNDVVKINELVKEVEKSFGLTNNFPDICEYTILDENENLVYKTEHSLSKSLNEAYKNKDTIVDFYYGNGKIGKVIVYNDFEESVTLQIQTYIKVIIIIACSQLITFIIYYIYLYNSILKPFKEMNEFAIRITDGNLDVPLQMDKQNNFGAFTEAFDIMRCEIKKSREAEKKANEAKKELVAKLSHDIKTPIASIKSYSELGLAISNEEKTKESFTSINHKADQINTLITNLFNSTLEELEELKINPTELKNSVIENLIDKADYLNKNKNFNIPECSVFADRLRLQQVFDNIFANSYKYANTNIETKAYIEKEYLIVAIKDFGDSIKDEEIPLLTEKFKRGNNTNNVDGTGLGLYISKELLKKMNGDLEIENDKPGFKVLVKLRII